jgi:hypothetical protein
MNYFDSNVVPLKRGNDSFKDNDPLTSLFYSLIRDHMPAGDVEKLVCDAEKEQETTYSNVDMARYAKKLADRLRRK